MLGLGAGWASGLAGPRCWASGLGLGAHSGSWLCPQAGWGELHISPALLTGLRPTQRPAEANHRFIQAFSAHGNRETETRRESQPEVAQDTGLGFPTGAPRMLTETLLVFAKLCLRESTRPTDLWGFWVLCGPDPSLKVWVLCGWA